MEGIEDEVEHANLQELCALVSTRRAHRALCAGPVAHPGRIGRRYDNGPKFPWGHLSRNAKHISRR